MTYRERILQEDGSTMRDGDRDPAWPEGFYWSEEYGRPVYSAQRGDASAEDEGSVSGTRVRAAGSSTGVPHLERACELLWQHGHPAIAEALEREVKALL